MKYEIFHDLVEANGKTIRQNNLEKKHNIPIGSLVEDKKTGVRLFVVYHARDCDGTPLYCLCHDPEDIKQDSTNFCNRKWVNGYSEEDLKIVLDVGNSKEVEG